MGRICIKLSVLFWDKQIVLQFISSFIYYDVLHCAHSMLIVKDSMILIHLAKMQILTDSCRHFGNVLIPTKVYEETEGR